MAPDPAAPPAFEVGRLLPADWEAVREIRLTALAQAPDAFASTLEREQAFDEKEWRTRLERTAYFGAWAARPDAVRPGRDVSPSRPAAGPGRDGSLAGLVATFPEPPPETADASAAAATAQAGRTWHLVAMWVSPDRRGQGIADRLVAAVCDLAQAGGGRRVALWVADANPRAQAVYRRLGFRLSGERGILRPGAAGQPDLWEARMTRDLEPAPAS
jgi:ribosomal protein S18 acetylase RimI-like enzyme